MNIVIKRLLWAVPTLMIIILSGFILQLYAPGDPVQTLLNVSDLDDPLKKTSSVVEKQKKTWEKKLGLDLPVFYITLQPACVPDTLYKITHKKENNLVYDLCMKTGNLNGVLRYREDISLLRSAVLKETSALHDSVKLSMQAATDIIYNDLHLLYYEKNIPQALLYAEELSTHAQIPGFETSVQYIKKVQDDLQLLEKSSPGISSWWPHIRFHSRNRFHQWMFGDGTYSKGLIRGDFGFSYIDKTPVGPSLLHHLQWSVFFSLVSILLAYLVSIPLGIRLAVKNNTWFDKIVTGFLFALYAVPVFFLATVLQTFFANDTYLHIFEPTGIYPVAANRQDMSFIHKVWLSLPYMVLPMICFTYASLAFLTKLTKTSIMDVLHQPFIITARAKGLPYKKVIYKHAFRNALLPLITIFSNIFPLMVGGSVIIERIFTIPGMGNQLFLSYFSHDLPVIISIFTFTGIFTIIGFLITDLLYAWADPRIRK